MNRNGMSSETAGRTVQILDCYVEKIHRNGLVDVKQLGGGVFNEIPIIGSGIEGMPSIGDRCIVISDGAKKFILGFYRKMTEGPSGEYSARNQFDDFSDLNDSKVVSVTDDYGNMARLMVSKGGGALVDGGESCITHWNPALGKIHNYCQQSETISESMYFSTENDGDKCKTVYKWRTIVDHDSVKRDYDYSEDVEKDKGETIRVQVGGNSTLQVESRSDGEENFYLNLQEDGSLELNNSGRIIINSDKSTIEIENGNVSIESSGVGSKMTLTNDGKVSIGRSDGAAELLSILDELIQTLLQTQVTTLLGPQPFLTLPQIAVIKAKLQLIKQ